MMKWLDRILNGSTCEDRLQWERNAVLHWQNQSHFYRAELLKALRTNYEMQKGIRRLVEKNKRLKKELTKYEQTSSKS